MGVHHVSSRPHAKENLIPQRHITGGKNGDILGFKIRYYTGYHVQSVIIILLLNARSMKG